MKARLMLAGLLVLVAGMWTASGDEPPGQGAILLGGKDAIVIDPAADLSSGLHHCRLSDGRVPTAPIWKKWQSSSRFWRYCSNRTVAGYEAQRDDFKVTSTNEYLEAIRWIVTAPKAGTATGGNMKSSDCP